MCLSLCSFGPVAVVGTYYVQSGTVGILPAVASVAVGLVGTSLLDCEQPA